MPTSAPLPECRWRYNPSVRPRSYIASVLKADVLLSRNIEHIVKLQRTHGNNAVNRRHGDSPLEIRSPREVLGDD